MPKYYCDYCDCYLVSSSIAVRKQHNNGAKHKANVKAYYLQFIQEKTQKTIDDTIANFEMMRNSGMLPAGMPGMGRGGMMGGPPGMMGGPPGMMGGPPGMMGMGRGSETHTTTPHSPPARPAWPFAQSFPARLP
jgi:U1 small nuclear ribonucleoprotein C